MYNIVICASLQGISLLQVSINNFRISFIMYNVDVLYVYEDKWKNDLQNVLLNSQNAQLIINFIKNTLKIYS